MAQLRGLAYPLQTFGGNLVTHEDTACVEDQIISVIETRPLERVMRGDYGFDPKIFDTLEPNAINARLYAAISQEVEGLTSLEIEGNVTAADDGLYAIKVKYALNGVPQPTLNLTLNI